jgi:hypothetical protein
MNEETVPTRFRAIGPNSSVSVICERYNAGEIPICPVCGHDLAIAYTWKDAAPLGIHPGVCCMTDSRHFQILFNVVVRRQDVDAKE